MILQIRGHHLEEVVSDFKIYLNITKANDNLGLIIGLTLLS